MKTPTVREARPEDEHEAAEVDRLATDSLRKVCEDHLSFLGLGVHTRFRRRGVAGALIGQLETIGRNCGCTAVILHTVRETGNVDVFQRLGFLVESEELTTLFESDRFSALSEVVMRKDIMP